MFGKNTYGLFPAAEVSPSLHSHASTSEVITEVLYHHHNHHGSGGGHHILAGNYYLPGNNAPIVESADNALFNQEICAEVNGSEASAMGNPRKLKRDRHSKIYTSQGPRDRRVRLSIGIARKFFDLQEMLGFDKPSKTLDWLLTKSKTAIKDLVLQTKRNSKNDAVSPPSEIDSTGNGENSSIANSNLGKGKSVAPNSNKSTKDPQQIAALNLAKESRVKARARARERTREKMCIKQMNETRNSSYDLNPYLPIQYMNNQLHEFFRISGSTNNNSSSLTEIHDGILHFPQNYGTAPTESIVIARKSKNPSILGFQTDLCQNVVVSSPYCDNWNIGSILDHPKFMNSNSNYSN